MSNIATLKKLGEALVTPSEQLEAALRAAQADNPWFVRESCVSMLQNIAAHYLSEDALRTVQQNYALTPPTKVAQVGIIMAGNIPLVGFHDWLMVMLSGHHALVKLSEKDTALFKYVLATLTAIDAPMAARTTLIERLNGFDAVIATGSTNSTRYFDSYFGRYPHIIRGNRQSIGVLTGQESKEELIAFGKDIFTYFGLGCRNVSKVYVPSGYDFIALLDALHEYNEIILVPAYKHNFDYNIALNLLNKTEYMNNGCLILVKNKNLASRIATLHYSYYDALADVSEALDSQQAHIQVMASNADLPPTSVPQVALGSTQIPSITDFADGVDTLQFLLAL